MSCTDRTKQKIFEAFSSLLETYPFEKITVEMIVKNAKISKSTFYRHFQDKYDLLNYNSMALSRKVIGKNTCQSWLDFFLLITEGIYEDASYFRKAFTYSGQNCHSDFLYCYSFDMVSHSYLTTYNKQSLSIKEKYIISQYCHGCVGIIQEWLQDTSVMTPKEISTIFYNAMPDCLKNTWIIDAK